MDGKKVRSGFVVIVFNTSRKKRWKEDSKFDQPLMADLLTPLRSRGACRKSRAWAAYGAQVAAAQVIIPQTHPASSFVLSHLDTTHELNQNCCYLVQEEEGRMRNT